MAYHHILLLATLVGVAISVPFSGSRAIPRMCRAECPVMMNQKLPFVAGKTYIYSYEGRSETEIHGLSMEAKASLHWEAEVALSMYDSCHMTVEIRNPIMNGKQDRLVTELLTKKSMLVAIKDGVVYGVCADVHDTPTSLNMKKGVISSIQNVVPHFSPAIVNNTFIENDIFGQCPTVYSLQNTTDAWIVNKNKDHKLCSAMHTAAQDSSVTGWVLKNPVIPINESHSECTQYLRKSDGLLVSVSCNDTNIVKGLSKPMVAVQRSRLSLKRVDSQTTVPMPFVVRNTNLTFEAIPQPSTEEVVPEVRQLMTKLCSATERHVEKQAAAIYSKIIGLLYRVSASTVRTLLDEIRAGRFCKEHGRLESLYLDAIAFISNAGAIEIMVDEVVSQKVSGGRTPLYTMALHLVKRPSNDSVKAIKPLFNFEKHVPSSMVLAAGSLVGKYCKFHPQCLQYPPVQEVLEKLDKEIKSSCSSSVHSQEKKVKVLTALKAIGNIGNITNSLERTILQCVRSSEADVYVRVVATQAYRHASCRAQPTSELVKLALEPSQPSEIRIASYVSAIKCASYEEAQRIVSEISREPSTQVRSYILSHLRNLQSSDDPQLKELRYNLTSLVVPSDYEKDVRKYSRNVDLSYYMPSLGLGGGIDSNIIYAPGSYIPRQLSTNITADLFDNLINVGEFGLRMEDFETVLGKLIGPDGYLMSTSKSQMMASIMGHVKAKATEAKKHFDKYSKQGDNNEMPSIPEILKMFTEREGISHDPKVEAFARMFGKEVLFASFAPHFDNLSIDLILEKMMKLIAKLMDEASHLKVNVARGAQVNFEYFNPTAQGIPLQFKAVVTGLAALNLDQKLTAKASRVVMRPELSFDLNGFVGYSIGAKSGLRSRAEAYLRPNGSVNFELKENKVDVVFDLPEEIKLVDADIHTYMMNKMPSKQDQRISPREGYPVRENKGCSKESTALGIEFCYDTKAPDHREVKLCPLGDLSLLLYLKKQQRDKAVLKVATKLKAEGRLKSIEIEVEAPAAENPNKGVAGLEYITEKDHRSLQVFGRSPNGQLKVAKIGFNKRSSSNGHEVNIMGYYGNSKTLSTSDQVMLMKLKGGKSEEDEVHGEFALETKKILANYIKANIEVSANAKYSSQQSLPTSIKLGKFEVDVSIPETISTRTFIRKISSGDPRDIRYKIHSLTNTPKTEVLSVMGQVNSTGEIARMTYEAGVNLTVKSFHLDYDTEAKFVWTRQHQQVLLSIKEQKLNNHVLLANVSSIKDHSSPSYQTIAKIHVPSLMQDHEIEGSIHLKEARSYDVNMIAKKEHQGLFEVQGAVILSPVNSNILSSKTDLVLKCLKHSNEYSVKSKFLYGNRKAETLINLRASGRPIFSVEGEIKMPEYSTISSSFSVAVPNIIDAKFKANTNPSLLQLDASGYLRPRTEYSRKVNAAMHVDLQENVVKASVDYDMENDPSKKLDMLAHYNYNNERKFASVKGDLGLGEKRYQYMAETILGSLARDPNHRNELKMSLTKPDGQYYTLQTLVKQSGSPKTIEYMAHLNSTGSVYKIDSQVTYDFARAPADILLKVKANGETPSTREVKLDIDSTVQIQERQQLASYKMEITAEKLRHPIVAEFVWRNNTELLKTNGLMDLTAFSSLLLKGQSEISKQDHIIRNVKADVLLVLKNSSRYEVKVDRKSCHLSVNDKKILALEHSTSPSGIWVGKLTLPTRQPEGQSVDHKSAVTLNEDPRELQKGSLAGSLELDIFKKQQDKVVVEFFTKKYAERSYQVNADLKIQSQATVPRLELDVALSPEVMRMQILIKKSPLSPPTLSSYLSYNKVTEKNSYLYASFNTTSDSIELISSIDLHDIYRCRGRSMNGTLVSNRYGSFDFASAFCTPGYLELGAKNRSENKMYLVKLGMKDPASLKVAIDLVYNASKALNKESVRKMEPTMSLYGRHKYLPKIPILLIGAKVWTPMFVTLDAQFNKTGLQDFEETVIKPAKRGVRHAIEELQLQVPELVKQQLVPRFPDISPALLAEIEALVAKVHAEIAELAKEIGVPVPSYEELIRYTLDAIHEAKKLVKKVYGEIESLLEHYFGLSHKEIDEKLRQLDNYIKEAIKWFRDEIKDILDDLKDGKEGMKRNRALKWAITTLESTSVWDWIAEKYHELMDKLEKDFKIVQHFFVQYYDVIKDNIKSLYYRLRLNNVFVRRIIKGYKPWFNDSTEEHRPLVSSILTKFYGLYLSEEEGFVRVQVPLRRPVSSIVAALYSVGIPLPSRHGFRQLQNPSWAVLNLIHPYRGHASLSDGQLVTFDGLEVPMIPSNCEILLTNVLGDKITARITSNKQTEVKVVIKGGKEFKIFLDENKQPRVPVLGSSRSLQLPGVNITREEDSCVVAEGESFAIKVRQNTFDVIIKPWAFDKAEGLMGDHDGDKTNDYAFVSYHQFSEAKHHVSKESAREMVQQHRIDKSCPIPQPRF